MGSLPTVRIPRFETLVGQGVFLVHCVPVVSMRAFDRVTCPNEYTQPIQS